MSAANPHAVREDGGRPVGVATAPAETVRLGRNRNFNLLWLGEGVSLLGNATTTVLLPLLAVVSLDAGPPAVGMLTAAAWLPWLVIGLPAGAWVDRLPPRAVMVAADLAAAAVLLSVPVAWLAGVLTLPHLVGAAFGNGVATVFFRAAYPALIREVAPAGQQERAFSRLFGTESAMQVAGPGLGGLLVQAVSAVWGLLLDAASFLVSAVCLARLRLPRARARGTSDTGQDAESLGIRILEGVRFIRRDRLLSFFTVLGGVSNFGLTGYSALLVLFMVDELGVAPGTVGFVMAAGSIGGLAGAAVAPWLAARTGSARALVGLQLLAGPPALLIATATPGPGVVWIPLGTLLAGIGVVAGNVIRGAWRNRYVPESILARSMTASQVINFGTMPLAGLAAGSLGAEIGVRSTIALMAAIHTLACLAIWWSPLRGLRDMPDGAESPTLRTRRGRW